MKRLLIFILFLFFNHTIEAQNKIMEGYIIFALQANSFSGDAPDTFFLAKPLKISYSNKYGSDFPLHEKASVCLKDYVGKLVKNTHHFYLNPDYYAPVSRWDLEGSVVDSYQQAMEIYNSWLANGQKIIETGYDYSNCSLPSGFQEGIPVNNKTNNSNSNTQNIGNISSVSSNTNTTSSQNQVYFDAKSNMYTTPEIEAIKARSQAKYERNMQKVQVISNAVTGLVNYFEQQRQQRLAYEERQRQLKEQEERKKELFQNQAYQYRKEYTKIINARKSFLNPVKLKSTLDEDGTGFKPLYIYYAYVPKNYDYYYENVSYPSTLDFKINQNIDVKFSPVFGFFPYSNGQYPFIKDIKSKILYDHFGNKAKGYDVVFFQWENSVENIVSSLKGNLNKAVNESYFAKAIPSINNNIVFLNTKINASQSKDYWTGEKVKTKNTKKVDYFSDGTQKSNSKKDYWKTSKKKKTVKDSTNTKKKKVNYWDN